jgi:hypothetical protein
MALYTTVGSVRGCCDHVHLDREAAERCLARDREGCASQGGYSDRRVVHPQNCQYEDRGLMGGRVLRAFFQNDGDEP